MNRENQTSRRAFVRALGLGMGFGVLATTVPGFAEAATGKKKKKKRTKRAAPRRQADANPNRLQPVYRGQSHLVMDAATGEVLVESNADGVRFAASLTKLMTAALVFEALESGKASLTDSVRFSARAAGQHRVRLFENGTGRTLPLDTAIKAICVKSSNDVAWAVAEHVGGTALNFVHAMNRKAKALGMTKTDFFDPNGLNNTRQCTSARDMALLARHIIQTYPQYMHYFAMPTFTYNGTTYNNSNRLTRPHGAPGGYLRDPLLQAGLTPDGMKTGYISNSKHNLVATAADTAGTRLIAVTFGQPSQNDAAALVTRKMLEAYDILQKRKALTPGAPQNAMRRRFLGLGPSI